MDHPAVAVAGCIRPHARIPHDRTQRPMEVALRSSSGRAGIPAGEMFRGATDKTSWHAVDARIGWRILSVPRPIPGSDR